MSLPRRFETPDDLQKKIDAFFKSVEDKNLIDPENPVNITLTGMIIAIGLASRNSFDEYLNYEGFGEVVRAAKLRVEAAYEQRLHGAACTGSIFALKNFGWKDQQAVHHSGSVGLKEIMDEIDGNSSGLPQQDQTQT